MPCYEPDLPDYEYSKSMSKLEARAEKAEAMLCGFAAMIETVYNYEDALNYINWKEVGVTKAEFKKWWADHKKADVERRKREEKEKKAKARAAMVKERLKKSFTQEEINILRNENLL